MRRFCAIACCPDAARGSRSPTPFSRPTTSSDTPADRPASISARFPHSINACTELPILPAIEPSAAQRDGYSRSCSNNIRTALSRALGLNLFVVLLVMAPSYLRVGASRKARAAHFDIFPIIPSRELNHFAQESAATNSRASHVGCTSVWQIVTP